MKKTIAGALTAAMLGLAPGSSCYVALAGEFEAPATGERANRLAPLASMPDFEGLPAALTGLSMELSGAGTALTAAARLPGIPAGAMVLSLADVAPAFSDGSSRKPSASARRPLASLGGEAFADGELTRQLSDPKTEKSGPLSWIFERWRRAKGPAVVAGRESTEGTGLTRREPRESDKELLELREKVEKDAYVLLQNEVGGDLGRPDLFNEVQSVLTRLQSANAMDPDGVSLHLGGSFIPNAFTTITDSEVDYLKKKGRLKAVFKNSNVFVSRGLLEAYLGHSDAALAFVLAHELAHNRLGHLKSMFGSFQMLGHLLEFDADVEALRMIARAGYDPREALGALELIEERIDALAREYPLFRRENSEFSQLLYRWRDIHPNHALRRAKLEKNLAEALEIYRASAYHDLPQDRLKRIADKLRSRPVEDNFARFEAKAQALIREPGKSFYEKIVALEGLIAQRIHEKEVTLKSGQKLTVRFVRLEDQLIVENVFRGLSAIARDLSDLDQLYQLYGRLSSAYRAVNFPSRKARAYIVESQIKKAAKALGPTAAPEHLEAYVGKISGEAFSALFQTYLKRVGSAEEWDKALAYIGQHAQLLGLTPGGVEPRLAEGVAKTLLQKTMALSVDQKLPTGEKAARAIEYLLSRLPATLLTTAPTQEPGASLYLSTHLKAEVLDLFFTGRLGPHEPWNVPALALLLEGKSRGQIFSRAGLEDFYKDIHHFGVMGAWNRRYYSGEDLSLSGSGKVMFNYERLQTARIKVPAPADLINALFLFPYAPVKAEDESNWRSVPARMPEALAETILRQDQNWQESFWEKSTEFFLEVYIKRQLFADSSLLLNQGMQHFGWLQVSVVKRSPRLAPLVALLNGVTRALQRIQSSAAGADEEVWLSRVADLVIRNTVNELAADQLDRARNSKDGMSQAELESLSRKVLELDEHYASFNTTERLRTLADVFHHTVVSQKDPMTLLGYVRAMSHRDGHGRGGGITAQNYVKENKKLFAAAGLEDEFPKLLFNMKDTVASGALGLMADPRSSVEQLLGASFAAYLKEQEVDFIFHRKEKVDQSLAFLLVDEAARRIQSPAQARAAAEFLVNIHDIDPLYLSYVAREEVNDDSGLHSYGSYEMIRAELLGALVNRKQPFRQRDAQILRRLLEAIKAQQGFPKDTAARLKLLDWAGRAADYDAWVEDQILETARQDPKGFAAWAERDEDWLESVRRNQRKGDPSDAWNANAKKLAKTMLTKLLDVPENAIQIPDLKPAPLRIIRNPVRRAELYRIVKREALSEKARHRYLRERRGLFDLGKAYWKAKQLYSNEFLRRVVLEANPDARVVLALEEASRVADEKADAAQRDWEAGRPAEYDKERHAYRRDGAPWWRSSFFRRQLDPQAAQKWASSSATERRYAKKSYRDWVFDKAIKTLWELGEQYSAFIDPELGYILDNFPEPTRVRDDLLERLAKSRTLTPERMSLIESYKSYRYPNPLRFIEKQFLEAASVQMSKLSASERVDLILHLGGVKALPPAQLRRFEGRMLGRDRRAFVEKNLNIYSLDQLLRYLDQLHPDDKELFVESMFYGKQSISSEPVQVDRLFRSIAIDGRGLPSLVEKIMSHYFDLLTPSEKVAAISQLIKESRSGAALSGPEIVKLALKSFGITGAKIGQVLATHKGLLPQEYAAALESFKDEAQSLEKARVMAMLEQKMALLLAERAGATAVEDGPRRRELEGAAEFLYPEMNTRRREKYVREILALERISADGGLITEIAELGRELGSGSIKIVYKVKLKDGGVWVAKLRRPGATVKVEREFEILNGLTAKLLGDQTLKLPNLPQLVAEVEALVRAELNFSDEAAKEERTRQNVLARDQLENLAKKGGRVLVPQIHERYLDEDVILEEFIPSVSFKDLPDRTTFRDLAQTVRSFSFKGLRNKSLWRTTKNDIARAILDEAAQELILDGFLDPDRHSGNVLKRSGFHWRGAKPVWIDLGQSVGVPWRVLKPLLKAGLGLKYGKIPESAQALAGIFELGPGQSLEELKALLSAQLGQANPDAMERLLAAIIKAEGGGYLVSKDYAALEKAILLLNGYASFLPTNYFLKSLERAVALRIRRENPQALPRLLWYRLAEGVSGADHYAELLVEIDKIRDRDQISAALRAP